jgi:hypothetical protein
MNICSLLFAVADSENIPLFSPLRLSHIKIPQTENNYSNVDTNFYSLKGKLKCKWLQGDNLPTFVIALKNNHACLDIVLRLPADKSCDKGLFSFPLKCNRKGSHHWHTHKRKLSLRFPN